MEKEANQLYRRPQMTGQARDEEEDKLYQHMKYSYKRKQIVMRPYGAN